jgi:hypothetical protein
MAQKTRPGLQTTIDSNLPDNTTDFITPLLHREVEEDLKDSNFNILDDTAFNVNYPPTTPSDWLENEPTITPTETGEALDVLVKKSITNPPDNIAYVSTTGSDTAGEFELGNPLKPFLTFQAAIDAVGSIGKVIVEPGNYPQQNIDSQNQTQLTLIMDGVTANIPNFQFISGSAGFKFLSMRNAVITSFVLFRMDYTTIKGGRVNLNFSGNNGNAQFNNSYIEDLIIVNTSGFALNGGENSFFSKCFFQSSSIAIKRTANNTFQNCTVLGANCYEDLNSTTTSFQNCKLISTGTTLIGANNVVLGTFENCVIESTGSNNMSFTGNSTSFYALNCRFKALTDNIVIINDLLNRTIDQQTTFEGCRFNAGTGEVLVEPVSYTLDQGTTLFLDCKINKVALTGVSPIRVTDNNTYSNINLQYFG